MFEGANLPLLSRRRFAARMAGLALAALIVDGIALSLGAVGYRFCEGLGWLDAALNAALVMTGNGSIYPPHTIAGKLFTMADALLGVILFAGVIGVLLIPVFHRMIKTFHSARLNDQPKEPTQTNGKEIGNARAE